jgi:hypothetical protein
MKLGFLSLVFATIALGAPAVADLSVQFVDITKQAGIRFIHHSGATGKKLLPEAMGSGCAFIDLDGDGWADILLVNGKDWERTISRRFIATTGMAHLPT